MQCVKDCAGVGNSTGYIPEQIDTCNCLLSLVYDPTSHFCRPNCTAISYANGVSEDRRKCNCLIGYRWETDI